MQGVGRAALRVVSMLDGASWQGGTVMTAGLGHKGEVLDGHGFWTWVLDITNARQVG